MAHKKRRTGSLLLAGLAAYAIYRYSKMTDEEKREFVSSIREKGKKFYDENIPEEIKQVFERKSKTAGTTGENTGAGSDYQTNVGQNTYSTGTNTP